MSAPLLLSVLLACSPSGTPTEPWLVEFGMTSDELKNRATVLRDQGYRPTCVSGYNLLEGSRFAVIWEKLKEPTWVMEWNLTPESFDKRAKDLKSTGYRPMSLSGYDQVEAQGFIDLWGKADGPAWDVEYGVDATGLRKIADRMKERGYRPRSISSYGSGTISRYASIWEKGGDVAWDLKWGLTGRRVDALKDLSSQGYRPLAISGLGVEEQVTFSAVWEKRKGADWLVRYGLDSDSLTILGQTMREKGYKPVHLAGYQTLKGVRFASIWEKGMGRK